MQLGECFKLCVGAGINYFIPHKKVKFSNCVPSPAVVSLTGQDLDIALKSPSNIKK